ncbi:MAG: hypothetical protein AAB974_01705 [Patescibacteria group bacterium]
MSAYDAQKCFEENRRDFGNAQTQPEKYNLYNGLANLAQAVATIQRELDEIKRTLWKLDEIKSALRR